MFNSMKKLIEKKFYKSAEEAQEKIVQSPVQRLR